MTIQLLLSHKDNGFDLESGFDGLIGLAIDNRTKGYIGPEQPFNDRQVSTAEIACKDTAVMVTGYVGYQ